MTVGRTVRVGREVGDATTISGTLASVSVDTNDTVGDGSIARAVAVKAGAKTVSVGTGALVAGTNVREGMAVRVATKVSVGTAVSLGIDVRVGRSVRVALAVGDAVGVEVGVGAGSSVAVSVDVGRGVRVGVALGAGVAEAKCGAVPLEGVLVTSARTVTVGVTVEV
ncbi:MAG: hypothetical protein U0452_00060 [Anaerolineae bacterium]